MNEQYTACWYDGIRRPKIGDLLRFLYTRHEAEGRSPDKLVFFMSGIADPTGQYLIREEPFDRRNKMCLIWSSE